MILVKQINSEQELNVAFEIRRKVFVEEQEVDPAEEYDEFESTCIHFVAKKDGNFCGTARIRKTENGYKLERFAVLKEYRSLGVGAALVNACLHNEILQSTGTYIYMHAQQHAVDFYAKFGFTPVGELFYECEIPHYKMFRIVE